MAVHSVTDATFEAEVLRSELPVLVDLYADWCQPCKQVSPIVAQVAEELADCCIRIVDYCGARGLDLEG